MKKKENKAQMAIEEIDKRLIEIPGLIANLNNEQHRLIGYKQALIDLDSEKKVLLS